MHSEREQRLVDYCFSLVLAATAEENREWVRRSTQEDRAKWVADKLAALGFPTTPVGASWGVLVSPTQEQIAHIREHQAEFDEAFGDAGERRDVAEYFKEYDQDDGSGSLYLMVCADLGLEPRARLKEGI